MPTTTAGIIEAIRANRERLVDVVTTAAAVFARAADKQSERQQAATNEAKIQTDKITRQTRFIEAILRTLMLLVGGAGVAFGMLLTVVAWGDWVIVGALWWLVFVFVVVGLWWARKPFGNGRPPVAAKRRRS